MFSDPRLASEGNLPDRLEVRLEVSDFRNEARHLPQSINLSPALALKA